MKYLVESSAYSNSFLVKISSNKELVDALIELKKIGALGTHINVGSYLGNNDDVDDIISGGAQMDEGNEGDVSAIAVQFDDNPIRNKTWNGTNGYPRLYGKNHIIPKKK